MTSVLAALGDNDVLTKSSFFLDEGMVKIILTGDVADTAGGASKDDDDEEEEEEEEEEKDGDVEPLATGAHALDTFACMVATLTFSLFRITSSCVDPYNFLQAKHLKDCICPSEQIIVT